MQRKIVMGIGLAAVAAVAVCFVLVSAHVIDVSALAALPQVVGHHVAGYVDPDGQLHKFRFR